MLEQFCKIIYLIVCNMNSRTNVFSCSVRRTQTKCGADLSDGFGPAVQLVGRFQAKQKEFLRRQIQLEGVTKPEGEKFEFDQADHLSFPFNHGAWRIKTCQ